MSSTAPASNQDKGKGKQTCRRQQAIIAAHWATQVRPPDGASPLLALRLGVLRHEAKKALAVLKIHKCDCIDCRRPIPKIGDKNKHGEVPGVRNE